VSGLVGSDTVLSQLYQSKGAKKSSKKDKSGVDGDGVEEKDAPDESRKKKQVTIVEALQTDQASRYGSQEVVEFEKIARSDFTDSDRAKAIEDKYTLVQVEFHTTYDQSMFGRFSAGLSRSITAAASVAHSLSTNSIDGVVLDSFSAREELADRNEAAHLGVKELAEGVMYSYSNVSIAQLAANMECDLSSQLLRRGLRGAVGAFMNSQPSGYVHSCGHRCSASWVAVSFSNRPENHGFAFETPVNGAEHNGSRMKRSIEALCEYVTKQHRVQTDKDFGLREEFASASKEDGVIGLGLSNNEELLDWVENFKFER